MKLQHIGQYVINPYSIAYINEEGTGSRIHFNSYAAVSDARGDTAWESFSLYVPLVSPLSIMALINNEPSF